MANVSHASLTGSEVHEPKGISGAALGTVYVSNGAGSGSWSSIGTSAFTGMVADFLAPVAPAGWLELDGSVISTSTYSALYGAMSITTSGTRSNGSPIVTSIPDTSTFRVGYYVFGTGIATGTTILSVDSATQITLSGNASSSGSSSFAVSPWLLNTGTIQLPDLTTSGRYRRSRTSTTKVGDVLADQNQAHTHTYSATTSANGSHNHAFTGTPGTATSTNSNIPVNASLSTPLTGTGTALPNVVSANVVGNLTSTYTPSGTNTAVADHTHTLSGTTTSNGGTEARPVTIVMLTCVKT